MIPSTVMSRTVKNTAENLFLEFCCIFPLFLITLVLENTHVSSTVQENVSGEDVGCAYPIFAFHS